MAQAAEGPWLRRAAEQLELVVPTRWSPPSWADRGERRLWLRGCIGAWTLMGSALLASVDLLQNRRFVILCAVLLAVGFPLAYRLHFVRVPRGLVNIIVFWGAAITGYLQFRGLLGDQYQSSPASMGATYRLLVHAFLWIIVFRAPALRTLTELVLTIIPTFSCIILVLIRPPTPASIIGSGLLVISALYLLALQAHTARTGAGTTLPVLRRSHLQRGRRPAASLNTWQTVAAVALVVSVLAGIGAARLHVGTGLSVDLQVRLAQYLARYFMSERRDASAYLVVPLGYLPAGDPNRVLFTVECPMSENWRQQVYARYDGRSWATEIAEGRRATQRGDMWEVNRANVTGLRLEGAQEVVQKFRVRTALTGPLPCLFVASRVRGNVLSLRVGEAGVLVASGYIMPGKEYEVTSLVPPGGMQPDPTVPALPEIERKRYLQLPDNLPSRIGDLARQYCAGARSPYDAARRIEQALMEGFAYRLRATPPVAGTDFVDQFLFVRRTGFCVHFASAMVVMCRTLGMPARFVTGYLPGRTDESGTTHEVRFGDAHAWAEVYLDGFGWVAFDPTPPAETDTFASAVSDLAARSLMGLATLWARAQDLARAQAPSLVLGIVGILLLLGTLTVRRQRLYWRLQGPTASPRGGVRFAFGQMTRWLTDRGIPRGTSQTPFEYEQEARAQLPACSSPVRRLTGRYVRARFAPAETSTDDLADAQQALAELRQRLRKPPREDG
jgi:hypothetical protein